MQPMDFVERLRSARATAILRTNDPAAVAPAMTAAVEAGFRVIEFTLTNDEMAAISALARGTRIVNPKHGPVWDPA